MIGFRRDEEPHIHAAGGAELQRGKEEMIRHEISGSQPEPLPGRANKRDDALWDGLARQVRAAGDHLNDMGTSRSAPRKCDMRRR